MSTAAIPFLTGKQTARPKLGAVFCHCFILSAIGHIIYIKNASNPFARIRVKQIAGITYKPDSRAQCEKSRCHSDGRKTQLHLYGSTISDDCQYSPCMSRKERPEGRSSQMKQVTYGIYGCKGKAGCKALDTDLHPIHRQ